MPLEFHEVLVEAFKMLETSPSLIFLDFIFLFSIIIFIINQGIEKMPNNNSSASNTNLLAPNANLVPT